MRQCSSPVDEHEHVGAEGEQGKEVRMGGQKRTNAETNQSKLK
jgi:hypothetical protein